MARIHLRGKRYHVEYRGPTGKLERVSLGPAVTTKRQAQLLAAELELKATRQSLGLEEGAPRRMTFAELWTEYDTAHVAGLRDAKNVRSRMARHLMPALRDRLIHTITPAELDAVIAGARRPNGRPLSPQTRLHLRNILSGMWEYAIRKLKVLKGPSPFADDVDRPKPAKREPRFLLVAQVAALLAKCQDEFRALFAVAVYCGLRKGELCGLRLEDVDLTAGFVTVRHSYDDVPKDGDERPVPIPDALVPYLRPQLVRARAMRSPFVFPAPDGSMRGRDWKLDSRFKHALVRAGLVAGYDYRCRTRGCGVRERRSEMASSPCPRCRVQLWIRPVPLPFTFKDLRSTYGTHASSLAGLNFTAQAMGHADEKTTAKHYRGRDLEQMREAVRGLKFERSGT